MHVPYFLYFYSTMPLWPSMGPVQLNTKSLEQTTETTAKPLKLYHYEFEHMYDNLGKFLRRLHPKTPLDNLHNMICETVKDIVVDEPLARNMEAVYSSRSYPDDYKPYINEEMRYKAIPEREEISLLCEMIKDIPSWQIFRNMFEEGKTKKDLMNDIKTKLGDTNPELEFGATRYVDLLETMQLAEETYSVKMRDLFDDTRRNFLRDFYRMYYFKK